MNYDNHPKNNPDLEDRIYEHVLMFYYWNASITSFGGERVRIKCKDAIDDVIAIARVTFYDTEQTPSKKLFYRWLKRKGIKPLGLRFDALPVQVLESWTDTSIKPETNEIFEEINGETIFSP